jgi:hypothetical protein
MFPRYLVAAAAAVAAALGAAAAESLPASGPGATDQVWRELTSSHFVLLTDFHRDKALTLLAQLEFSRAGLVQAVLDGHDDEHARLEVVAFATADGFAPYAADQPTGTEAFVEKNGATKRRLVLGPVPEFRQQLNLSHEIAHHLLFLRYPIQPPWFREGMAKFLESVSRPPADRLRSAWDSSPLS